MKGKEQESFLQIAELKKDTRLRNEDKDVFIRIIERIQQSFPSLQSELTMGPTADLNKKFTNKTNPNYDLYVTLKYPKQPGLCFDFSVCLWADELQMETSGFFADWFPCTDEKKKNNFSTQFRACFPENIAWWCFPEGIVSFAHQSNGQLHLAGNPSREL